MPTERPPREPVAVLLGGVGELYQGDLDLGRVAVERLAAEDLGKGVLVEDLHYGAVAVAQRLEELGPRHFVLIGGVARGRHPGTVERRRAAPEPAPPAVVQEAVADAVTGYVSLDLVVEVAAGLGVLPPRTVVVEVEPASTAPSDRLTPVAASALEEALAIVRAEVARVPLLELAQRIDRHCEDERLRLGPSPALTTVKELVRSIAVLGDEGRWGRVFAQRERLKRQIDAGLTGERMDTLDWALWWSLIEELDRLFAGEADRRP